MRNITSLFLKSTIFFLFGFLTSNAQITSYPYVEDFESGAAGWTVHGITTSWELGNTGNDFGLNAPTGNNSWVTKLGGDYLNNENGWVQSPVFDLSSLTTPTIQLNIASRTHFSQNDGAVLQSSINSGTSWQTIGAVGEGTNWYNQASISSNPGGQSQGWSGQTSYHDIAVRYWVTAIHSLTHLIGQTNVIFRVVFTSDNSLTSYGIAFDEIYIVDSPTYAGLDKIVTLCSNNTLIDLDNFNDENADIGGVWSSHPTSSSLNISNAGEVNLSNASGSNYFFIYTTSSENGSCTDTSEIWVKIDSSNEIYDANLDVCATPVYEEDLLDAIGNPSDPDNGSWNVDVSGGVNDGEYTFTFPATSTCPEYSATVTVSTLPVLNAGGDTNTNTGCDGASDNLEDYLEGYGGTPAKNSNSKILISADRGGTFKNVPNVDDADVTIRNGKDVDFTELGAGQFTVTFEYSIVDDCGLSTNPNAIITVVVTNSSDVGFGESTSVCQGEIIDEQILNSALLGGDSGGIWTYDSSLGSFGDPGTYKYSFDDCSGSATFVTVTENNCNQELNFTFANPHNTNDGVNDFYEVDVMVQTINSSGSFKLGSGELFFNYNTVAFGTNIFGNGGFEATYPDSEGYICAQGIDSDPDIKIYGNFNSSDISQSLVKWSFSQQYSEATFTNDNVTETPKKLCHLKFKYLDKNLPHSIAFDDNGSRFFTACGPNTGTPTETTDCSNHPGLRVIKNTFDSNGAALSNTYIELFTNISLYPNPAKNIVNLNGDISKIKSIEVYSITGQKVMNIEQSSKEINISQLNPSIYFVKLKTNTDSKTFKIVKK